jgi:small subunit ribosomal protein S13
MARIAGVDLPRNKKMGTALTYIYGIGPVLSKKILADAQVNSELRADAISEDDVARIREVLEKNYKVEGDLRQQIQLNIKRLMDMGCYRGLRHRKGLPVRGQRTSTNARTRKGPRAGAKRR